MKKQEMIEALSAEGVFVDKAIKLSALKELYSKHVEAPVEPSDEVIEQPDVSIDMSLFDALDASEAAVDIIEATVAAPIGDGYHIKWADGQDYISKASLPQFAEKHSLPLQSLQGIINRTYCNVHGYTIWE